ncbi:MAG: CBS domain-containing protein [Desulfurococcales archaeon]|nr:CBS domain-containing protein [Desulfurococcales archaeon]
MAPRVSKYMTTPVMAVRPTDTLAYARNLMLKKGISRLVVVEDDMKLAGVVTASDIAEALVFRYPKRTIDSIRVEEAMTRDVISIEATRSVKTAAQLMLRNRIGGLPVLDAGGLAGIITRTDIVRSYADRYRSKHRVGDVMREATVANRGHSVFYIARLLYSDPSGKVIIVDSDNRPIGVVAKRDLLFTTITPEMAVAGGKDRHYKVKRRAVYSDKIVADRMYLVPLAENIMTPDPIVVRPGDDLAHAASIMVSEGIGVLPVVDDDGSLLGVVTKQEILRVVAME